MYLEQENEIIEGAINGDINCFEKIVIVYEKAIYNICYHYFNNEEDAKDIAQEVFIKIFKNLNKYNFSCKFSTWAHKIAVNSCIDHIRKRKSRPVSTSIDDNIYQISDTAQSPVDTLVLKEKLHNLEDAINKMPEDFKTFLVLRDINGLSYQEIAEVTETNLGTVKSRISRARNFLKYSLINNYEVNAE